MAKANLGGNASARKSPITAFDNLAAPGSPVGAKVEAATLPDDLVAAILKLVKAGTQTALRDLQGQARASG